METSRRYRPDPAALTRPETWGRGAVQTELIHDTLVITASGEIDASNAGQLAVYLEQRGAVVGRLYVDLRGVTFFGTAGLAALRRVENHFGAIAAPWRIVVGPAVRKVLRICNAEDLPQSDSLDHVPDRRTTDLTPA